MHLPWLEAAELELELECLAWELVLGWIPLESMCPPHNQRTIAATYRKGLACELVSRNSACAEHQDSRAIAVPCETRWESALRVDESSLAVVTALSDWRSLSHREER